MTDGVEALEDEALGVVGRLVPGFGPRAAEHLGPRPGKADVLSVRGSPASRIVVAKREATAVAMLEERVYRGVLANLSVASVVCHGTEPASEPGQAWLVTDYAGGVPFERGTSGHSASLARWIAAVHSGSRHVNSSEALPAHGTDYWQRIVVEAVSVLDAGASNDLVARVDRAALLELGDVYRRFLDGWTSVERLVGALPDALTHGDLVPQNISMATGARLGPLVHDWGEAGWGTPAIDLLWVDLETYAEAIEPALRAPLGVVHDLGTVGSLLWTAFVLGGERYGLTSGWPHRSAEKVPVYLRTLRERGVESLGTRMSR